MLVPDNIYESIDDIIERSYTGFIYRLIGDEFLTEDQRLNMEALGLLTRRKSLLELLYLLVKQRSEERYQTRRELRELLEGVFSTGVFDQIPITHQATINNALRSMDSIVQEAKSDAKRRVKSEIIKINKEYTTEVEDGPVGLLVEEPSQQKQEKSLNKLFTAVGAALLVTNKVFHKQFTGELTDFVNRAAVDAADEKPKEVKTLAYKVVVNDSHLCEHCHRDYVNEDGTPKLYDIKELVKNGTNDGKPKFLWKPVVGPHHFRCRCQLVLTGSDFDDRVLD